MLASIFSLNVLQTALELGCIYALVALALFLSYSILNIADLSTDGCFTLGCAVACQVALCSTSRVYGLQARRLTSLFHCRRTNRLRGGRSRRSRG